MAAPTGGAYKRAHRTAKVSGRGGGRGVNHRKSMVKKSHRGGKR